MANPPSNATSRIVAADGIDPERVAQAAVKAAGGVVWQQDDGALQILLIHRPRYDDWSLPKGKLDPGESFESAARREIKEETGVDGPLGQDLGAVFYTDHKGRAKVVRWWAVQASTIAEPSDTDEVDEFRWTSPDEAALLLSYDTDIGVLQAFLDTHTASA